MTLLIWLECVLFFLFEKFLTLAELWLCFSEISLQIQLSLQFRGIAVRNQIRWYTFKYFTRMIQITVAATTTTGCLTHLLHFEISGIYYWMVVKPCIELHCMWTWNQMMRMVHKSNHCFPILLAFVCHFPSNITYQDGSIAPAECVIQHIYANEQRAFAFISK